MPDNRLDTVPLLEVVKVVEELVDGIKPEVICTHHPGDLNIDHGVINRAVLTVMRPMAGRPVREHPGSAEAVRSVARRWGSVVGCPAAEGFESVRSIRSKGSSA